MSSISLQVLVKDQFIGYLSKLPKDLHYVLIVDEITLISISAVLNVSDLLQYNIALIERLNLKRQPFPQMGAVYLISSSEQSVEKMLEDWDSKKRMYKDAFIFFSGRASDQIMAKLKSSKIVNHVKQFIELNVEFLAIEPQLFTYRDYNDHRTLYSKDIPIELKRAYISKCAEKLASVFSTLNDIPYIRYKDKSELAEAIAKETSSKLRILSKTAKVRQSDKTICLIVDRDNDPISPLIHEVTYQAMAYDILNIGSDQLYSYRSEKSDSNDEDEERTVFLNDKDDIWVKYRHKFLTDAEYGIKDDFKKFKEDNPEFSEKTSDLKKRVKIVHKLGEFQKKVDSVKLHQHMIGKIMSSFEKYSLKDVGIQEQNMAVDQNESGESLGNVIPKLEVLFKKDIPEELKLRLVLLYLATQGTKKQKEILKYSKILDEDKAEEVADYYIERFVNSSKESKSIIKNILKIAGIKSKKESSSIPVTLLWRYQPRIKDQIKNLIMNKLDVKEFPYVIEPSSPIKIETASPSTSNQGKEETESASRSKRKRPTWVEGKAKKEKEEEVVQPLSEYKIVVFVIGGATYSESRSMYELTEETGVPCYLGSTSIITPKIFIKNLGWDEEDDD